MTLKIIKKIILPLLLVAISLGLNQELDAKRDLQKIEISKSQIKALLDSTESESVILDFESIQLSCKDFNFFDKEALVVLNNTSYHFEDVFPKNKHRSFECLALDKGKAINLDNFAILHLDEIDSNWALSGKIQIEDKLYALALPRKLKNSFDTTFVKVEIDKSESFQCEAREDHDFLADSENESLSHNDESTPIGSQSQGIRVDDGENPPVIINREAKIAIETDNEFWTKIEENIDNPQPLETLINAIVRVRANLAAASVQSCRSFNLALKLYRLYLYNGNDPWVSETSKRRLSEMKSYWRGHDWVYEDAVDENTMTIREEMGRIEVGGFNKVFIDDHRPGAGEKVELFQNNDLALAFFISGIDTIGGTADGPDEGRFDSKLGLDNGAFGISGITLDENLSDGSLNWESYERALSNHIYKYHAFVHELSHIFGSDHTRCYEENGQPLDRCGDPNDGGGCYFDNEDDYVMTRGTVMSYCYYEPTLAYHPFIKEGLKTSISNLPPRRLNKLQEIQIAAPVIDDIRSNPERVIAGEEFELIIDARSGANGGTLAYRIHNCHDDLDQNPITTLSPRVTCLANRDSELRIEALNKFGVVREETFRPQIQNSLPVIHFEERHPSVSNPDGAGFLLDFTFRVSDTDLEDLSVRVSHDNESKVIQSSPHPISQSYPLLSKTFTILNPGLNRFVVSVTDTQGATVRDSYTINIINNPPELSVIHPEVANQGEMLSLFLNISDDFASELRLHIDWGNGDTEERRLTYEDYNQDQGIRIDYTYDYHPRHIGEKIITISLQEEAYSPVVRRIPINVLFSNATPIISNVRFLVEEISLGRPIQFFADVSDPNMEDRLSFQWEFSDGRVYHTQIPTITHSFSSYKNNGLWLRLTVTDEWGEQTSRRFLINEENNGQDIQIREPQAGPDFRNF